MDLQLTLSPFGRRVLVQAGITALDAARQAGIELAAVCGGNGTCGACKVRLVEGLLSPLNSLERSSLSGTDLEAGYRLACQAQILADSHLDFPPESLATLQRLQLEGRETLYEFGPAIRLLEARLPLRSAGENPAVAVQMVLRGQQIIAVLRRDSRPAGLAIDIGTTKIAAYLVDLKDGKTLARAGLPNPQIAYGEDVISRIAYANQHADGRQVLQQVLIRALNDLINDLCMQSGLKEETILDAVWVGNTVMHHLAAGLPVQQLGTAPYIPAVKQAMQLSAREIGLSIAPGAQVYLPPNIAGFVGADHVAMLLACAAEQQPGTVLALDIGTNTEISLYHQGRHLACSCASGPAFEGAHIRDGMRAAPGAIERIRFEGDQIQIQTVQGQPPVGICGSGILDGVAELRRANLLDERGAFIKEHPRIRRREREIEFILTGKGEREIGITRKDVNEIQLAKAAIRSGIQALLRVADISSERIDHFIVAGAMGTYLDLNSAIQIGMFPALPLERFHQVGNAAGAGARQLLCSVHLRQAADLLAQRVEYVELTGFPGYSDIFMEAIGL